MLPLILSLGEGKAPILQPLPAKTNAHRNSSIQAQELMIWLVEESVNQGSTDDM
jgi:hypothetical protein